MSESKKIQPAPVEADEIDLRELLRILWAGRLLIAGITTMTAVVAVVVALLLPDVYRAEALLAPNDREGAGGLAGLAAQYGGLASLAGINLGSGAADKTALGLEILQSRKFVSEYIERHNILVPLLAAKGWNAETGDLIIDSDDYDLAAGRWIREVSLPKKTIPSMQEAYEEFLDVFSVRRDSNTGFVTVVVEHYSPIVAKQWVDWLIDDLNSAIMRRDVAEAEQAIEYLNEQISSTSLSELQAVFFRLIEEQTKTVMLAKVTDEYLLKTIDPAVAPELKARPKRAIIVIVSTFLGSFLAIAVVLLLGSLRRKSNR